MKQFLKNSGPAILVTAAFIGPGTITVCTLAGVTFGYSLLWALLLSVIACIVLQEMAARLGILRQEGLSEILKGQLTNPFWRVIILTLIFSAIVIGNAAYEAGNISGAALGLQAILPELLPSSNLNVSAIIIGLVAFAILYFGNYKVLERILVSLVILMSFSFLITMLLTKPDITAIFKGLFVPSITSDNLLTVMALVGTTVVPYNLFLHASLVSEKWNSPDNLPWAKKELIVAIALGGIVSMAILICAASTGLTTVNSATDLAESLTPLFGDFATVIMNTGLIAAGITSAITAPLAAAYVAKGCFGWTGTLKTRKFRSVWMTILILGIVLSSLGIKPIEIIHFAQIANGILLPVIAVSLLWLVNKKALLGSHSNTLWQNIIGGCIVILSIVLGVKAILKVLELL